MNQTKSVRCKTYLIADRPYTQTPSLNSKDLIMRLSLFSDLCRKCVVPHQSFRQLSLTLPHLKSRPSSPPSQELKITFSSSSGPGGQNVNKLATKVDLRYNLVSQSLSGSAFYFRFHIGNSNWLSPEEKEIVQEKLSNYITKDGFMVVKSDKTRSQTSNQEDAVRKLSDLISNALKPPEPKYSEEELERMRRGKIKANKERLKGKKFRGDTKRDRGGPGL